MTFGFFVSFLSFKCLSCIVVIRHRFASYIVYTAVGVSPDIHLLGTEGGVNKNDLRGGAYLSDRGPNPQPGRVQIFARTLGSHFCSFRVGLSYSNHMKSGRGL